MKATIFFIITTILWGLNYHWSKFMVIETSPFEASVWRYSLAVGTLLCLNFKNLPKISEIRDNMYPIFIVGVLGLYFFNFFFFQGMALTTPINAVLIIGLNPALTLIFSSIILKTPISIKQIVGIFIAMLGVMYLLFKGDINQIISLQFSKGDLLIMLSSVFFALHHVWVKKYSGRMDNAHFSLMTAVTCFVFLSVTFCGISVYDEWMESSKIIMTAASDYTMRFWIGAIGIGCFGTGIAYWFWYKGIALSSAPKAAMFINIVPLSGSLFSIALGDDLMLYHFVSCFLIVSGILIMQFKSNLFLKKKI